jgi:hypothetical protein
MQGQGTLPSSTMPSSKQREFAEEHGEMYPPDDGQTFTSKETHSPLQKNQAAVVQRERWFRRIVKTRHQRLFLFVILVQGIAVLALQSTLFGMLDKDLDLSTRYLKSIEVYLSLFILAEVTEILFALDALRLRNFLQVVGLLFFSASMLAYSCLMYTQVRLSP